jgi:fibronectin type 3 domain-containing protein
MLLDGAIRADGGDSWYVGGGYENAAGSGGGIRLDVGTLEGAGIISADGGTVTSGAGGAGGGGRIAIYWWNAQNLDPAGITATGGTSAPGAAGAGTVHVAESEAPTDLVVAVDAAPVSAVLGQTILVSWTVTNQGSLPTTDAWADHVYLSADPVWDAGDRLLAAVDASARLPLAGHAAYGVTAAVTGGGWLVPNLPAAGQITLRVEVTPDLNVPSGGEFATSVTAYTTGSPTHLDRVRAVTRSTGGVQPDLAPLPGATPAEADFGQTLALAWTVANAGPGGALRSWTDAVYLSADDVWDAGDTLLASRPAPDTSPLAAGGSYLRQADVTVPNTTGGPHWLIFVTDTAATQPEADEANNAVAVAIDLHGPDLEVAEILGPVLAPTDGQVVTLTARIANTGTGEARGGFYVRFEVDGSLLGRQFVADAVPAGETIEVAQAWTARPGAHTVRVVVDDGGAVYELDDTDNAATLALPEVATADLAVTDVTWLPAAVTDSDTVVFTATLTSAAAATLRNFVVRFQVGGQTIGTQTITGGLGAGQAAQATASWAARPGDYTVVVTVDSTGAVAEADEGNNTLWAALPTISDETPPVVTNLAPTDGQTVRGTVPLAATATDNAGVTGYLFETSDDGLAWTVLGSSAGGTLAWDTGARADGGVQVRVTASDAAGHTATLIHTYVVDNTAPGALALSAAADQFAVVLSWPATAATDFAYYRLYRSETSGGPYTTINGAMTQTTFADRGVTVGTPYYYVLRVFDAVGNASDASAEAWAAPLPDGTVPTITAFSPAAGTRAAGVFHLSASATDNVGVAIYTFEFSDDGGATWQMIASGAASAADWNVSALPTGPVTVRVTAADAQGNASSLQRSLHVDHDGPDQPQNLRTTAGQVRVTVAWDAVLTPDFHHFVLYRAAGGGAMETHVASTTSTVFVDREVDFGVEYAYRVVAVDDLGNPSAPSADATVAPLADTTPPAVQTLSPAGGAYLRGVATLAATALDNVRVTSFVFEVAPAGTGAWTLVGQDDAPAPAGADRWSGSAAWDTSALPEGEYDVRVTAVDYGGNTHTVTATLANPSAAETDPANDTASAQVAVNLAPVANAGADREADWNAAVAFGPGASHDDDGLVTAYAWDFGDGATSGHASPTHAYQMPGAYTVTLTVTDTPTSWSRTCSGRRLTWATATRSSSRWS